ncbi:hypothetical protein MVEN_00537600 [Mycena venus]|uniref:BTB domain-containing protein n=1 Tax=Mycena venus TaxID=2733690 RepID=A0A8H6YPE8_9AGAR|nr:hypothetical protein MVEN_00537600 [Mycena venus]
MDDFSTNRHNEIQRAHQAAIANAPTRHPDLSFPDGNIAILTGSVYFLVHKGLLCRHSVPFQQATKALEQARSKQLEGRPILHATDSPHDMSHFLSALYDGILGVKLDPPNFPIVDALLRLTTKYQVKHIRSSLLREIQRTQWPVRTHSLGARPQQGIRIPKMSSINSRKEDLMNLLKGREHASRFLSTFIVNELEGRAPSVACVHGGDEDPGQRRACQAAFESITFEILRDVNGITHRSSDPLFAIVDAELMQTRDDANSILRACEFCRVEFGAAVDQAREGFWNKMPSWFGVDLDPGVWS